jgi:peroxiredoxin
MLKNIRITLLSLIIIILASCSSKNKQSNFSVYGTIENASNQKLLLQEIPFDGKDLITLDSTTLSKEGKFNFNFISKVEGLYRLTIDNSFEIVFINDEGNIEFKANTQQPTDYQIKGSNASTQLTAFLKDYRKKDSSLFSTLYSLDALQKQNGKDSTIAWLQKQRTSKINDLNQFVIQNIKSNNTPAFIYYALGISIRSMEASQVLTLAKEAAERTKAQPLINFANSLQTQLQSASADTKIAVGSMAPDFTLNDPNGKAISLSSLRGKYVLVDFWASWCGPCRGENPNVVANYEKYKNKNFTVLGVSLDEDKGAWQEAIKNDKLNWQHVSDLKKWESIVVNLYHIEGIPYNVLIDPTGKIIATELRGAALGSTLASVLQ